MFWTLRCPSVLPAVKSGSTVPSATKRCSEKTTSWWSQWSSLWFAKSARRPSVKTLANSRMPTNTAPTVTIITFLKLRPLSHQANLWLSLSRKKATKTKCSRTIARNNAPSRSTSTENPMNCHKRLTFISDSPTSNLKRIKDLDTILGKSVLYIMVCVSILWNVELSVYVFAKASCVLLNWKYKWRAHFSLA